MSHHLRVPGNTAFALILLLLSACQSAPSGFAPPTRPAAVVEKADNRSRELYLSAITQLIDYGKYHAAVAHLDEFERRYGPTELSRKLRGDAWLFLGELAKAETEYSAIAAGELAGYGRHGLGRVTAARGDWTHAVAYFEQAVLQQPTNTGFLNDFGYALFETGRQTEAEFQLRKALELSPGDTELADNLKAVLAMNACDSPCAQKPQTLEEIDTGPNLRDIDSAGLSP